MLMDDILMEEKFRDGVLVFMNDTRDKSADNKRKSKEVSGSHTIRQKRSVKKKKMNKCRPLDLQAPLMKVVVVVVKMMMICSWKKPLKMTVVKKWT